MKRKILGGLLASLLVATGVQAEGEPPPRVKEVIEMRCVLCHGLEGESASPMYPRLAGQNGDYLRKQLRDFRDGRRVSETMGDMVKDLNDEDINGLAAFFSGKRAGRRQPGDADLAAVGKYIFHKGNRFSGVASCASCHGENGHGTVQLPRLAGQHPGYVENQIKSFNQRQRTNDNAIMHSIASKLTELETKAVSLYIGGLE